MALYRATVKSTRLSNEERIEKGMSVEFASAYSAPLSTNGGTEVIDAFKRVYGVDIKKAAVVSSVFIEVVQIGK